MPDYSKGKIYSIRSHLTDDVYIGSTIETLSNRLSQHKKYYQKWLNKKTNYTSSFKLIEKDAECYIELVELYPCNSKNELCRREGEIIRTTNCVNKRIAGRTEEQRIEYHKKYNLENKTKLLTASKKHYNENLQKYKDNNKKWRESNNEKYNCICGSNISKLTKIKHEKTKKHQSFVNPN